MADKLQWIEDEIQKLKDDGLYNRIRTLSSPQGAWLVVDGKRVLNFCSNNYLGMANHPRIIQAAQEAVKKYGVGPAAVRSIAGTMVLHLELERRLATWAPSQPWWARRTLSSPMSSTMPVSSMAAGSQAPRSSAMPIVTLKIWTGF